MSHHDHLSTASRQHKAIDPPSSSTSGLMPPVLSFDIYLQLFNEAITPDDIEALYTAEWYVAACPGETGRRCPSCRGYKLHLDQIIVGIDGACRNNGLHNASASIGVVFGPESLYNISERVHEGPFTSQRAELTSALRALEQVGSFCLYESVSREDVHRINSVVIKSDSAYVVNGLTKWVWKWERNGYQTTQRTPVVNADLFQALVEKIYELKEMGMEMYFWKVSREFNKEADELANRALN